MKKLVSTLYPLLLLLGVSFSFAAEVVQTSWGGAGAIVLQSSRAGALVQYPDGQTQAIDLPDEAVLVSLQEVDGSGVGLDGQRWLLTASLPGSLDGSDGSHLLVMAGSPDGTVALRPPGLAGTTPSMRLHPIPLVLNGDFLGLAWMQGNTTRTFEVWAAEWSVDHFETPQRVAAAGPGSQLALTGAALPDGSWLLAWSRYDGEDDEIVSLRRTDEGWGELETLSSNRVPDITPTLMATRDGALLAWSEYGSDGYRVVLSRYVDGWQTPRPVGSGRALYPRFLGDAARPRLIYRRSSPHSWVVDEIDPFGERVLRRAAARGDSSERPAVHEEGDGYLLRWSTEQGTQERHVAAQRLAQGDVGEQDSADESVPEGAESPRDPSRRDRRDRPVVEREPPR